jgi:hypothetical protein
LAVLMAHRDVHLRRCKQRRARGDRSAYLRAEVLEGVLEEAIPGGGERRRQVPWVEGEGSRRPRREEPLRAGLLGGGTGTGHREGGVAGRGVVASPSGGEAEGGRRRLVEHGAARGTRVAGSSRELTHA